MTVRNIIQTTVDEFGKTSFTVKKAGSWYRRSSESIFVLNLQKSNYGPSYYLNVSIWLLAAGPADSPKPSHCHIQTRMERLLPAELQERFNALLDLDTPLNDAIRSEELKALLEQYLKPMFHAAETLQGLRQGKGRRLVEASLVDADGQRVLAE